MEKIELHYERARLLKDILENNGKKDKSFPLCHFEIKNKKIYATDGKRLFIFSDTNTTVADGVYLPLSYVKVGKFTQIVIDKKEGVTLPNFESYIPAKSDKVFESGLDNCITSTLLKIFEKCGAAIQYEFLSVLPKRLTKIYCYEPRKPILIEQSGLTGIILPYAYESAKSK